MLRYDLNKTNINSNDELKEKYILAALYDAN